MSAQEIPVPGAVPEGLQWVTVQLGRQNHMDLLSELAGLQEQYAAAGDQPGAMRVTYLRELIADYATHYTSTGPMRVLSHIPEESRSARHQRPRRFGWLRLRRVSH